MKNLFTVLILFSLFFSSIVFSNEAKIINAVGKVTINGMPAKLGDVVPVGAKVETDKGGTATIAIGEEDIMKVSSESILTLEPTDSGSKQVRVVLEKGRVEGVKKMEGVSLSSSVGATTVGTASGTMEITAGRYLIEQAEGGSGETKFLAVDGNAKIISNERAAVSSNTSQSISLSKGEFIAVKASTVEGQSLPLISVSERTTLPPAEVSQIMPPIASTESPQRFIASEGLVQKISFRDVLPPPPSTINRDPLQPVIPPIEKAPRVNVKFKY